MVTSNLWGDKALARAVLWKGHPQLGKWVAHLKTDMQPNLHLGNPEFRAGEAVSRPDMVWGDSPAMRRLQRAVGQLAPTGLPLLITGEAGSGRSTLARAIHNLSEQRDGAFLILDCAQVRAGGSPWDAAGFGSSRLPGGATVVLKEIGDLPPALQQSLVPALLETANGDGKRGIRWLASSSKDLQAEVRGGGFRGDLYARIAGIALYVPPLRHRPEDVLPLAESFREIYSTLLGCLDGKFSPRLEGFLVEHTWPGNVRELEDAVRTILAIGNEDVAMMALRANGSGVFRNAPVSLKQTARAASRRAEQELILAVLSRTRWNRKRAAAELQISYKALLYKLKQIGLEGPIDSLPGKQNETQECDNA